MSFDYIRSIIQDSDDEFSTINLRDLVRTAFGYIRHFAAERSVSDPAQLAYEMSVFTEQALVDAAQHGADYMLKSINDGTITETEYTKGFTTPDGYISREGVVNTLTQGLSGLKSAQVHGVNVRDDESHILMIAFGLGRIDMAIACRIDGDIDSFVDEMAIAAAAFADAEFHHGFQAAEKMAAQDRTNAASQGGNKAAEPWRELKVWARSQFRTGTFKSAHAASWALATAAQARARELGIALSPMRAQKTVYEYLLEKED